MRLKTSFFFSLGLLLSLFATSPSLLAAQDEFDDDFDAEPPPRPQPPRPQPPPPRPQPQQPQQQQPQQPQPAQQDEFGDLEEEPGPRVRPVEEEEEPAPAPPAAAAPADDNAERAYRERRHILHNSWSGSVGGLRVIDAGSGAPAAFRAQLGTDFFFIDGWLTNPEASSRPSNHSHIGGSLSLSWNPFDFIEFYASIASWANSNPQEDPNLFQVLGDTLIGVKGYYRVLPWLFLGGDVGIGLLNTVGDIGLVGDSTSVGIRLNASADLRELDTPFPLIARLNLQYYFDNSYALVAGVEQARYGALLDPGPCPSLETTMEECYEDRHLITRVERYALQIDRVDRFTIGVGFEVPLKVMEDFHINPIVEWVLNIASNRQGYSCFFVEGAGTMGVPPPGHDGCLDYQGAGAYRQTLTIGVRVLPPLRGLSIFAAVDIGLTGVNTMVRELAPQAPYDVLLGFGYAFDTVPQVRIEEREVVREVDRTVPPPPKGRIVGVAVERGETATPIARAIVSFPGRELTALSTDEAGAFRSYELEPGVVQMTVTHPEYNEGTCTGTIPPTGGDVEVRCELEALPRLGMLRGRVIGEDRAPIGGAAITLSGPASRTLTSSPDGTVNADDLPPGSYTARVEAENFLIRQEQFEVRAREEARPEITLIARPRQSLVQVRPHAITIRRQVNFATDSAEILPTSNQLMSELADVILRHPEITRLEIQGHTDNRGARQHNIELSQRRAEAVRDWLIAAGVEAGRLEARGYGPDQPLVPNITAANRARNRRVQFVH